MSRIRSVHPSLWTDEAFVSLTLPARLFMIGIWTEADDYGLFEWKPLRLKMRLAPADTVDASELLGELVDAGFLVRIERDGKAYGAVKNFRRYQRPKNPSAPIIGLTPEILGAIGLPQEGVPSPHMEKGFPSPTPGLPQSYPRASEISPQMEDGGDKIEEVREVPRPNGRAASASDPEDLSPEDEFWRLADELQDKGVARSRMGQLAKLHDGDFRALVVMAREIARSKSPPTYIGGIISRRKKELAEEHAHEAADRGLSNEPDFVVSARREGAFVEKLRDNAWRIGGYIYDRTGEVTGF